MVILSLCIFIGSKHPSLSVLCLLATSLISLLSLKTTCLSISFLMVLIMFSSGVLLLLFYVTMLNDKNFYWDNFLLLYLATLCVPYFYTILNLKFSSFSHSMEMSAYKSCLSLLMALVIFLLSLIIVSLCLYKMKFTRQII